MARRLFAVVYVVVVCLVGFSVAAHAQAPANPTLDSPGFQENREYFAQMPFENIDTLSGALILTFTDLVLPGDAGRELRFQHTYNSKSALWTFGIAGIPLRILNPAPPSSFAWPEFQRGTPTLFMADGSNRMLAWYANPNSQDPGALNIAISMTS